MQALRVARRLPAACLAAALVLAAQTALDYDRLRDFLKSSIEQGFKDKQIANYLKTQKLKFALSDKLIEEFVGWGIGPRTLQALEALQPLTAGLPAPRLVAETGRRTQQPPPPSLEEQRRIVAEARANAKAYTAGLPDYMCLQLTRRYVDPSGLEMDWLKYDEIKTRVSYIEGRERYELLSVNDRASSKSFDQLGGAVSSGEFGSTLAGLFALETNAAFTWARHSLLRGRPVYVFNVEVQRSRSSWSLTSHGARRRTPGAHHPHRLQGSRLYRQAIRKGAAHRDGGARHPPRFPHAGGSLAPRLRLHRHQRPRLPAAAQGASFHARRKNTQPQ